MQNANCMQHHAVSVDAARFPRRRTDAFVFCPFHVLILVMIETFIRIVSTLSMTPEPLRSLSRNGLALKIADKCSSKNNVCHSAV